MRFEFHFGKAGVIASLVVLMAGCATPTTTQPVYGGDTHLDGFIERNKDMAEKDKSEAIQKQLKSGATKEEMTKMNQLMSPSKLRK